ncbi:MAG TPA: serine hydrolase domain-containing protein, partial [Micromonosporaceae bacterium]|nr:serine hydrolase domain-containing protein [Micromonosporaceae bacterium]
HTPTPTPDTQYRIGSITKTFTAVLVMLLRDEGRLDLEDHLEQHLPGTPLGRASIRQLLGHASGSRREPGGPWWERAPGTSLDALLDRLDQRLRVHPPYRTFHYSNVAYALLAALAGRITGESWSDLVSERLLAPLAMHRTTYQCEEPFARGYVVHPWLETLREEPRHDAGAMAPAGQLWSTVADLARWAAFLASPAAEVINPVTVEEMAVPVTIIDPQSWSGGYGLGLQLTRRGERVFVGHGGSMPGYLAMLMVHQPSGVGALAFCNAYNPKASIAEVCGKAIEVVLDNESPPAPGPWQPAAAPPPGDIAPLCGRWWFMGLEHEVTYDRDQRHLVVRSLASPGAVPWRFISDGTDLWQCVSGMNHGEQLTVRRGPDGTATVLDIATFEFLPDPWPDL